MPRFEPQTEPKITWIVVGAGLSRPRAARLTVTRTAVAGYVVATLARSTRTLQNAMMYRSTVAVTVTVTDSDSAEITDLEAVPVELPRGALTGKLAAVGRRRAATRTYSDTDSESRQTAPGPGPGWRRAQNSESAA